MANRITKCVRTQANGLTILSVGFRCIDGKIKQLTSDDTIDIRSPILPTATDAKAVSLELDRYYEIVAIHSNVVSADGFPLTMGTASAPSVAGGRMTIPFSIKAMSIDTSGADPVLAMVDNEDDYTAFVTLIVKNSKARP